MHDHAAPCHADHLPAHERSERDMTHLVNLCWVALAALHVMPSAVVLAPHLISRLYGVDPAGDVGLLLRDRGSLFVGVIIAAGWSLVNAQVRPLAAVLVAWSIGSFLLLYLGGERREGALQVIARWDLVGLLPLSVVLYSAWRR